MDIKQQMLRVLRSHETQRIHFSFTGSTGITIAVDASSFRRVAQAVEDNTIHPIEGGVADGWAQYDARTTILRSAQKKIGHGLLLPCSFTNRFTPPLI